MQAFFGLLFSVTSGKSSITYIFHCFHWFVQLFSGPCKFICGYKSYLPFCSRFIFLFLLTIRCFVSGPWPLLFGVALPVFFALAFNVVVYFRIISRLSRRVPGKSQENKQQERRKRIQNAVAIFLLLGLTWGLGYFCFIPAGTVPSFVFQMLFVTFNSGQGYLIFMLYCMRNPVFRQKWRKLIFLCPDRPLSHSLASNLSSDQKRTNQGHKFSGDFRPASVPLSSIENRRLWKTTR